MCVCAGPCALAWLMCRCGAAGPELVATVPSLAEVDATGCPQEWVEQLRQLRPDVAIRQ